ncbi:MAG: ABC transporter substrate-binding protein [Corynebacterium sp.]|nr:ABC transporter substrate-binding protein [Corynebacterium sp.]
MRKTLLAAIVSISLLAACGVDDSGSGSSNGENALKFQTVYPATSADAAISETAFFFTTSSVETLTRLNPETQQLEPWLATEWDTDDGITWTFKLRDDVQFHNGKAMDAQAVKASLEHAMDVNPGIASTLAISEISVVDDHTIEIVTDGPYVSLPSQLAHYNAVIVDVDADAGYPVGTGPFKYTNLDLNSNTASLEAFDDCWSGAPEVENLEVVANQDNNARVLALQSGEADVIYRPSLQSVNSLDTDDLDVDTTEGTRAYMVMHNPAGKNAELFQNLDFRKGLDALFDRKGIVDSLIDGHGSAANGAFPSDSIAAVDNEVITYDTQAALDYFEAAGLDVVDGKVTQNGQPISLRIATYNARPELPQIAQAIQDSAAAVGIDITIVTEDDIDNFLLEQPDQWDLATYSLNALTRGDGSYFLNNLFMPDGAQNYGDFADDKLVELITAYNEELDTDTRIGLLQDIAAYIADNHLHSYLMFPDDSVAFEKEVTGVVAVPNEFEYPVITKDTAISND